MRVAPNLPAWLSPDRCEEGDTPHRRRSRTYYRRLYRATPPWLWRGPHELAMRRLHKELKRQRKLGLDVHLDHVVPMSSRLVSGLNVPWNLHIIPAAANLSKSNHYWPDCPHENKELFELKTDPYQMRLPL